MRGGCGSKSATRRATASGRAAATGLAGILVTATSLIGCASKESVGFGSINVLSAGVINDPANKSLRFDLLKFGLEQFCQEMQRRGVALKLRDGEPNVGRFFATSCQSQVIDEPSRQSILVRYAGRGFAWTNVTQRVGFESEGLVEYGPDFQMHDDAMYIYFRPRNVDSTAFKTTLVESSLASTGIVLTGVSPDQVGQNVVQSQLRRGFTVVRRDDKGETEFSLGVVPAGQMPFHPFQVVESERTTLDNDRTEVHAGQQDYIGGFTVDGNDQALYLTMTLDGANEVDVLLIPKPSADALIQQYTSTAGPAQPQQSAFGAVLRSGAVLKQYMPVPAGTYALLVDNSNRVGQANPPGVALDDRAARIDYLVQVGDRP
ncbi:MAG TPA: hypothetical protein VHM70_14245 [Polyangiaceae bacterium]|nr:hypothetical protein [Polyangiaceae bacterium]